MITRGLGFRRGWMMTGGYGRHLVRVVRREVVRLTSAITRTVEMVSRWKATS